MDAKLIFARAQPGAIQITEHYHYAIAADILTGQGKLRRPKNEQDQAEGAVVLTIPLAAGPTRGQGFGPDAIGDLEHQLPKIWSTPAPVTARIGYLGLSGAGGTDLGQTVAVYENGAVLPVDAPVKNSTLHSPQALRDGRHTCRMTQPYTPHLPDVIPVSFGFDVQDEDEQEMLQTDWSLADIRFYVDPSAFQEWLEQENEEKLQADLAELVTLLAAGAFAGNGGNGGNGDNGGNDDNDGRVFENGVAAAVHEAELRQAQIPQHVAALKAAMVKAARQTFFRDPENAEQPLRLRFYIGLFLPPAPAAARGKGAAPHPMLTRMAIRWPVPTPGARLHLALETETEQADEQAPANAPAKASAGAQEQEVVLRVPSKSLPVVYVPEEGAIEWRNIPFRRLQAEGPAGDTTGDATGDAAGARQGGNHQTVDYATPAIILAIDDPAELDTPTTLSGEFEIALQGTLSGLAAQFFGADGKEHPVPTTAATRITCSFTLQLADYAVQKRYASYQHFQFDGVSLDELRVRDIVALLKDLGFRVDSQKWSGPEDEVDRWCILGTKSRGLEKVQIWVLAEGTHAHTAPRERRIPGGETFTSDVATGRTAIFVRGYHRGRSKDLLDAMLEFQQRLKQEFGHVGSAE